MRSVSLNSYPSTCASALVWRALSGPASAIARQLLRAGGYHCFRGALPVVVLMIMGVPSPLWAQDSGVTSLTASESPSSLALLDGEILFGFGEFELTEGGQASLQHLLVELERFTGILSIRIIGHTDSAGPAAANLALSQRRADWIRDQFLARYPNVHIRSIGAGESVPITSNRTWLERQRNRRVEVQVIATGEP